MLRCHADNVVVLQKGPWGFFHFKNTTRLGQTFVRTLAHIAGSADGDSRGVHAGQNKNYNKRHFSVGILAYNAPTHYYIPIIPKNPRGPCGSFMHNKRWDKGLVPHW